MQQQGSIFLDPNEFSEDGTVALGGRAFSEDGSILAYSISVSGSDWRTVKVSVADILTTVRPLLSAVLGRTKFWSQKTRIIEVCTIKVLLCFI